MNESAPLQSQSGNWMENTTRALHKLASDEAASCNVMSSSKQSVGNSWNEKSAHFGASTSLVDRCKDGSSIKVQEPTMAPHYFSRPESGYAASMAA